MSVNRQGNNPARGRKALLVYPEIPPTYWSFTYTLPFIGKKASLPPLGLLTVAALLPSDWDLRVVDMNVAPLSDDDLRRAGMVFISAMLIQKESFEDVVRRCNALGVPVTAGGPFPTECHAQISGVDHFVLNEAEVTLPLFLRDLEAGAPRPLYTSPVRPDIRTIPPPRYDLIDLKPYSSLALQYSRGCPYDCEFCDIVQLFGHDVRVKSNAQMLAEFDRLEALGWRGPVFIVDDNFIGNKRHVLELLPEIVAWQKKRRYPFDLFTEASINFAQDERLLSLAREAGFTMVFVGIETPSSDTLVCIGKKHNIKEDMLASVDRIQRHGIEVAAGFIVGFDSDTPDIFDRQIAFIRKSGIVQAMVGLLTVLPGTRLHRRLKKEGRAVSASDGNNTHGMDLNFEPTMDRDVLITGYKKILRSIYSPRPYFARCLTFLRHVRPYRAAPLKGRWEGIKALYRSLTRQTFSFYGFHYVFFMFRTLLNRPRMLPEAVRLSVKGHHFFKMTRGILAVEDLKMRAERAMRLYGDRIAQARRSVDPARTARELGVLKNRLIRKAVRKYRRIDKDFRHMAEDVLRGFEEFMNASYGRSLSELRTGIF